MNELSRREHLALWWSFIWRATLFGGLAGLVLGACAGVVMNLFGLSAYSTIAGGAAGFVCNLVATYWAIGHVLTKKKYASFSIRVERAQDVF
jgi:phosphotransferase system  glucose/maltose/N-acetylglucosamine-specific IIC component